MSEQCLELKNVCKSFRDFTLNNISFTLPQGYIMGLVGPNGAGKTTTIQLILNMLEKDAGKILAFGKDNVVSEKEIKQDIGIVFDSIFYVDSWTVKDTEKAVSIFYDNWRHDIFNDMVKRFDLPLYLGFVLCRKATFDVPDIMLGLGLSFLVFSTITGIQMPLFFKMGYTKAKLWSVIPFAVVMLLVVLPSFVSALSGILDFAQSHKELFAFACILTSCIIQFVSYHIAVIFYRKQSMFL